MQIEKCKLQSAEATDCTVDRAVLSRQPLTKEGLSERILEYADRTSNVVEALPDTRLGRRLADQLLRSGTSPLGNYEEACAAESKADFAHKLGICLKEVRESRAWLRLIARKDLLPQSRLGELIDEADQLARIIGQSIATAKGTRKKEPNTEHDGS